MTRPAGPAGLRRFVAGAPAPASPAAPPAPAPPAPPAAPAPNGAQAARPESPSAPPAQRPSSPFPAEVEQVLAARAASTPAPSAEEEKCEMCAAVIPADHGHVADLEKSSLLCACRSCYLLFDYSQAVRGRYRAVPDRYLVDPDRPMALGEWDELEIPVGLAFFLRSSQQDEVAGFYPSPAGATECRLDLAAWERLSVAHPLLRAIEPDVEAALICRTGQRDRALYRADRPVLRTGRPDAHVLEGLRRGHRSPPEHCRVPGQREGPGPADAQGAVRWPT